MDSYFGLFKGAFDTDIDIDIDVDIEIDIDVDDVGIWALSSAVQSQFRYC